MSKKKGLGRDVNTSKEVMVAVDKVLGEFDAMKLKGGLHSLGIDDDLRDELVKDIDDSKETAKKLRNTVENLSHKVNRIRTDRSSRFASRVVSRFLEDRAE